MERNLQEKIVASYRGLRKLLGKRFKDDFVISNKIISYTNLDEILLDFKNYEKLLACEENYDEYVLKKIVATKYYLMSLLKQNIKYDEYIKNTIGVEIKFTEQLVIDELINKIKDKLKSIKVNYTKGEIKEKFYNLSISESELKEYLLLEFKRQKTIVEEYLGLDFTEEFKIEFINDEIPYGYYLSIENCGYTLKVNLNLDNSRFNRASFRYAIAHEIFGHAMQLSQWKKRIKAGYINEICGCEEDYGPEIIQLEGVGEAIIYFIFNSEIDLEMEIELLLDKLHHLVQNNSYIMFNNDEDIEICVDYYCSNYVLSNRVDVKNKIALSKDDSFYRANLYSYGSTLMTFINISNNLDFDRKREFFREMYLKPMTYNQILRYSELLKLDMNKF